MLPLGAIAIQQSRRRQRPELLPLAIMPVLFGLQQAMEGLVWLALEAGASAADVRPLALSYLFFAFALWPSWIPWAAFAMARGRLHPSLQVLLGALSLCGLLLGLGLWLPLLIEPSRLSTAVHGHSIAYSAELLLSGKAGTMARVLYLLVIVLPLLLLPSPRLRLFALALLSTGLLADWYAHQTFTSVWCYLSALLSGWILWLVWSEPAIQPNADRLGRAP